MTKGCLEWLSLPKGALWISREVLWWNKWLSRWWNISKWRALMRTCYDGYPCESLSNEGELEGLEPTSRTNRVLWKCIQMVFFFYQTFSGSFIQISHDKYKVKSLEKWSQSHSFHVEGMHLIILDSSSCWNLVNWVFYLLEWNKKCSLFVLCVPHGNFSMLVWQCLSSPPCQVSDRGGERCYGSPVALWTHALTWWRLSPVRIPPATCGTSNMKKNAFPPKARAVLELQSGMWPVSALKVTFCICIIVTGPS